MFIHPLLLLPIVLAQSPPAQNLTYLTNLVTALKSIGLSSLADIAVKTNGTALGQALLAALPTSDFTIFAPTNEAFAVVPPSVANDLPLLANILSYHILRGNYTDPASSTPKLIASNATVGRTLLSNSSFVTLEGGRAQVLAWAKDGDSVTILNQPSGTKVINSTIYQNILINRIPNVLAPPGELASVLTAANDLEDLGGVLNSTVIPGTDKVTVTQLLDANSTRGYTLFAPNDEALKTAEPVLASLAGNTSALIVVLQNHYANGSTVYSPSIPPKGPLISAAGQAFTFTTNSSGTFVSSGASSAKIVKTNVLTKRGVVHVIDAVLANTASDATKAAQAFASATSAAAAAPTETAPIGSPSIGTGTSANGSGGGSGGTPSKGAGQSVDMNLSAIVGVTVAVLLVL